MSPEFLIELSCSGHRHEHGKRHATCCTSPFSEKTSFHMQVDSKRGLNRVGGASPNRYFLWFLWSVVSPKIWPNHEIGHIIVFLLASAPANRVLQIMLAANWPLPSSCLQIWISNLVKNEKKKHRPTFELTCFSGENDASGHHCKAELASPDPLVCVAHSTRRTI